MILLTEKNQIRKNIGFDLSDPDQKLAYDILEMKRGKSLSRFLAKSIIIGEMIERKTYKLYSRNEKDIILTPIKYDFINNGGKYVKYCPYRSIDLKIVIKDIDYEEIDMFKIQNYIDSLAEEYVSKPSINITKNQNDVELTCDYTLQKNSIYSVFNAIDEFLVIYEMLNKIVDEIVYMAY